MTDLHIFDFHGTLGKGNEYAVLESSNISLEKHRRTERLTIEDVVRLQGEPWSKYFREKCPDASDEEVASMVEHAKTLGYSIFPKHIKPIEDALKVLEEIKKKGSVTLVISITTFDALDKYLGCLAMDGLINNRIGITEEEEKLSRFDVAELKARKLLEYLKGKSFGKVYMTGDKPEDIKAGKKIGATTVYYNLNGERSDIADYSTSDLKLLLDI